MKRNLTLLFSLIVMVSMILGACTPVASESSDTEPTESTDSGETAAPTDVPAPTFSGTASITFVQEPDSLSPLYTSMFFSGITRDLWLKGLWLFDDNNQAVPEVAA